MFYVTIITGDFMNKLNTILFDLDGTLIDTNEIIIKSFEAVFQEHFPSISLSRNKILTFIGPTLYETFGHYTKDPFKMEAMVQSYRKYYRENEFQFFKIYPGVIDTLKELKDQGYNLGIVTSKYKDAAWPSFTYYNLNEVFDVFIALDDIKAPKPNKEPVLKALKQFDNVQKAIMIGDNKGDILAGKNAGIYSAGVSWSLKGSSHLMEESPDFMLKDMNDIFRIIKLVEEE
jgi:pyrophosphatase PpaX